MGHDRYDASRTPRGEHDRWSSDRYDRERSRGRDERGFFERAGDEIASWFGDDDHDRRHEYERDHGRRDYGETGRERSRFPERDRDEDRNWFGGRHHDQDRGWFRTDSYRGVTGEGGSGRSMGRQERDYRPMTGDYSRSESFSDRRPSRYDRPESNWDRDDQRRTSFAGSRDRSQHHDPHYNQWRERQLQELDRDYDEYHRERQSKFENDFGSWRQQRQQKRQMLGQVRERMEVVGSDGEPVGTVDKTAGDRIILAKSDAESGGTHHSISCSQVDRIEDNRVILDCKADEAKERWRDEDRSRALFEREDSGEMGPGVLDRSFSGTYR